MCSCIEKLPKMVADKMKADGKIPGEVKSAEFDNLLWVATEDFRMVLGNPITIKYQHTSKGGNVSIKKAKNNMHPNFCPFCGEKYGAEALKVAA